LASSVSLSNQQSIVLQNFNNSGLPSGSLLSIVLLSPLGSARKIYTISAPLAQNFIINLADLTTSASFNFADVLYIELNVLHIGEFSGSFGPISMVVPNVGFYDTFQTAQTGETQVEPQTPPTWGPAIFTRAFSSLPRVDVAIASGSVTYPAGTEVDVSYQNDDSLPADLSSQISATIQNFNNSGLQPGDSFELTLISSNEGTANFLYTVSETLPNNLVILFADLVLAGGFDFTNVTDINLSIINSGPGGSLGPITSP